MNDYNIYLLSNNNKETANYLRKLPFYQDISGEVFSCDYNIVRPNPDIYNILLNKYNLIPEECLFIDDNQNNINIAKELGFITKQFIPDNHNSIYDLISEFL